MNEGSYENDVLEGRRIIFGLLNLIGNKKEQIEYQEDVPIANVPAELICMWFDDHFKPESDWFNESFSANERTKIFKFSKYYEKRIWLLPKTSSINKLHKSIIWQQIVNKAKRTSRNLGVEKYKFFN